ncbi:MAG: hypothetical protein LUI61_03840 [Firmicutes bacterium]|nr:hypothetical protein [Bacillota bacterium]
MAFDFSSKTILLKRILIALAVCLLLLAFLLYLFVPFTVGYENIKDHIHIEESDGYLVVIYDYSAVSINFLALSDGTQYVCLAPDSEGRCYRQSIQITTNHWNLMFGHSTAVYQRELTEYGAVSGESIIINDNGSTTTVLRYDIEVYYRSDDGTEYLIWSLD